MLYSAVALSLSRIQPNPPSRDWQPFSSPPSVTDRHSVIQPIGPRHAFPTSHPLVMLTGALSTPFGPLFNREPALVSFFTHSCYQMVSFPLELFILDRLWIRANAASWCIHSYISIVSFSCICFLQLTVTHEIAEARISLYPLVPSLDIIHRSQM